MSIWNKALLIIVFAALAVIIAGRAHAGLFSAEEESRMTREAPYQMGCPYNKEGQYYDCPAPDTVAEQPQREDYLPNVVPEQTQDIPPLLPTMLGSAYAACRKAGKNSEYCSDGPHYGADDYQKAAGY